MADLTGIKVGGGNKVHAAHIIETREIIRFGRVYRTEIITGTPLCGCSIWVKRGGYGATSPVQAEVNCERCLAAIA